LNNRYKAVWFSNVKTAQKSVKTAERTAKPVPGMIIFFDWEGDGENDHVGIVEKVESGTVYTTEGNSGDSCKLNSYAVGSSVIYGYGCPAY